MTDSVRLSALREQLAAENLDGFIVPRADEHLGEYVPPSAERLAWLTGFTGSAGIAAVLAGTAAVFTDGRYQLQLAAEVDGASWEHRHVQDVPPPKWLALNAPEGARIGYDPWLISDDALAAYRDAGLSMVPVASNPIDTLWTDRPSPPVDPALPHALRYAGEPSAAKREGIARALQDAKQDAAVVTDPASIAWLLNIRGNDVPFTPVALGFLLMEASGTCTLFMDPAKLPTQTRDWFGPDVACMPRTALLQSLSGLTGKRVRVDSAGSPSWFTAALREAGAHVVAGADPCALPKACKNPVEQDGARAAHRRDAVALCRFLHWMEQAAGRETEMSAASRLLRFRSQSEEFRGESFPAISGAGEHGAIIHYRATEASDRQIRPDECYLVDSGAQYLDGTTDVTRTLWTGPGAPSPELQDRCTRVLKGHIAVATLRFPAGVAGPHLDAFARRALWDAGLDYDHGTGHGVGSYLSVHEGPAGISRAARTVPLAPGMILSDEPGYYRPGQYGIRLENLLLVQTDPDSSGPKQFLRFETLTLAPFDRRLILPELLTEMERDWLDAYHARVAATVGPQLDRETAAWLGRACAPL